MSPKRWLPGLLLGLPAFSLLYLHKKTLNPERLRAYPNPVSGYDEAVARLKQLNNPRPGAVHIDCRTRLLSHGQQTARVIVFFHGLTHCPRQFEQLARLCHEQGDTVLLPRLPHHGLLDRMNTEQQQLTAEELAALTDRVVDIAVGLGKEVVFAGISTGAIMAAWAGQHRAEVDRLLLIAPVFGLAAVPPPLTRLATNLLLTLPNQYMWWDPVAQDSGPGSGVAYPRFATHALGQVLRLAGAVRDDLARQQPGARRITIVLNANDQGISHPLARQVIDQYGGHGLHLHTFEFDRADNLNHDIIDPEHAMANTALVYPILLDLINSAS